jgi:hypothetical protein
MIQEITAITYSFSQQEESKRRMAVIDEMVPEILFEDHLQSEWVSNRFRT